MYAHKGMIARMVMLLIVGTWPIAPGLAGLPICARGASPKTECCCRGDVGCGCGCSHEAPADDSPKAPTSSARLCTCGQGAVPVPSARPVLPQRDEGARAVSLVDGAAGSSAPLLSDRVRDFTHRTPASLLSVQTCILLI